MLEGRDDAWPYRLVGAVTSKWGRLVGVVKKGRVSRGG